MFHNVLVPQNPLLPGSMMSLNFIEFAGAGTALAVPAPAGNR